MNENESIQLLRRFQSGDETAANELFDKYVNRLLALAGSRLSKTLNRRVEAEDIVQSAFRSFFGGTRADGFDIQSGGQLWGLLAAITINKVRDQAKFHAAGKRAVAAEQSMNASRSCYGLVPSNFAEEPTIDEVVALEEQLKSTLESLPDLQRDIFELYLQNQSPEQIAEQVRRSTRTVRRSLEQVRQMLETKIKDMG